MSTPINQIINANSDRLDAEQAALLIGVKVSTLALWRCTKKEQIPYYKIGKKVFYKAQDVLAWMETKKVKFSEE